jgi:serine/threonine protein kinase
VTSVTDADELSFDQAEALRKWLQIDGPANTLGSGYQASIYLYQGPAGEFVIKKALGSTLRRRFSEASIRREEQVYRRLSGVPGIPRCFGLLDEKCLVLEYISGDSYRKLEYQLRDRERFFSKLLATLNGMHEAGVAHADLKRKDNILVGPMDEPYVIDFGIAIMAYERRSFLFNATRQADLNAWIKHKYQGQMETLSEEDREIYKPMVLEKVARIIRVFWQKLTLRRWRKKDRRR